jgi:hypothetical protein
MKKHILALVSVACLTGTIHAQSLTITLTPKQYEAVTTEVVRLNAIQTNIVYTPQSYMKMLVGNHISQMRQRQDSDAVNKLTKRMGKLSKDQREAAELVVKAVEDGKNIEIK